MFAVAAGVVALDQFTKFLIKAHMAFGSQKVLVPGFFKLVHWGNTGAAWSMFYGNNEILAIVSLLALLALFFFRNHFDTRTISGQVALGCIFGGIIGNLIDRLNIKHVTDFIYFYVNLRGGGEAGFAAFNIADSAICTGVGLLFLISMRQELQKQRQAEVLPLPQ